MRILRTLAGDMHRSVRPNSCALLGRWSVCIVEASAEWRRQYVQRVAVGGLSRPQCRHCFQLPILLLRSRRASFRLPQSSSLPRVRSSRRSRKIHSGTLYTPSSFSSIRSTIALPLRGCVFLGPSGPSSRVLATASSTKTCTVRCPVSSLVLADSTCRCLQALSTVASNPLKTSCQHGFLSYDSVCAQSRQVL